MPHTIEAEVNAASRLIDRHVQANLGGRRALEYGEKHYSFHDLAALANRAGNLLKALGVRPGTPVLMLLSPSPACLGALIGAIKAGAAPVLVPQPQDGDAVDAATRAGRPALALVHADHLARHAARLAALDKANVVVVGEAPAGYPSFIELMRAQPSSLAAEAVSPDAPALTIVEGEAATTLSHAQLESALEASDGAGLGSLARVLRALAKAETAKLA
jgi:acyl-coenzyme A synthetase/AMP-(fatty) acid ligase